MRKYSVWLTSITLLGFIVVVLYMFKLLWEYLLYMVVNKIKKFGQIYQIRTLKQLHLNSILHYLSIVKKYKLSIGQVMMILIFNNLMICLAKKNNTNHKVLQITKIFKKSLMYLYYIIQDDDKSISHPKTVI